MQFVPFNGAINEELEQLTTLTMGGSIVVGGGMYGGAGGQSFGE